MTVLTAIPAPCGTCDHAHTLRGCPDCHSSGGECPGWTATEETIDNANERELHEMIDLGDKALLDVDTSDALLQMLTQVEHDIYTRDKKPTAADAETRHPQFFALQMGPSRDHPNARETLIGAAFVEIADEFWEAGVSTQDLIDLAQRWVEEEMRGEAITIGWGMSAYGAISATGPDDDPTEAAHLICATDIDGRIYTVIHGIETDARQCSLTLAHGWAKLMNGEVDPHSPGAEQMVLEDGLSEAHEATTQLTLITRVYAERLAAGIVDRFEAEVIDRLKD